MKNTKENDAIYFAMIDRWKASKQTKTAFCKTENIRYHVFYYWHAKYHRVNKSISSFIKLPSNNKHMSPVFCELHFISGTRLVFNQQPSVDFVKGLL